MSNTRHAWRRDSRELRRWQTVARYMGFLGVLVLVAVGVAGLFVLVRQPFEHPRVQFLFLSGADLSGNVDGYFDQSGVAFPAQEFAGLDRSRQIVFGRSSQPAISFDRWRTPNDLHTLGFKIVELNLSEHDIAIVEIVAAGVAVDGEAQLCWNFGRATESTGLVRVDELLQQITTSTSACKLVILDAGNVESLPRDGIHINDFSHHLEKLVHRTQDESLWVLCSHGPLESSHALEFLKRSVFGHYLEQALSGAADLNGDYQIDVGELHGWVAHNVARYVDRRSGGMESQTPQLYWGGSARLPVKDLPIIVPARQAYNLAASKAIDPKSDGTNSGHASVARATGDTTAVQAKATTSPEVTATVQELVSEGWRLAEILQIRKSDSTTAVDLASRLVSKLTDRLRAFEILSQDSGNVSSAELSGKLLPILSPLRGITSTPPVLPQVTGSGLGTRLARAMQPLPLPEVPVRSLALAELLAARNIQKLANGFSELGLSLNKFINQNERTGFDEWLQKLEPAEQSLAELYGLASLARIPDIDWTLLREVLTTRMLGERASVMGLGCFGIVSANIQRGDNFRIAAEKLLLDGIQPERNSLATTALVEACSEYRLAEQRANAYTQSVHLKNDLLFRARDYVRWRQAAARRSDSVPPEFDQVAEFLVDLRRYCELIEKQSDADEMEINDLSSRLTKRQRQIEASAAEDFVQTLATSASGPKEIAQIEALLETSFVPANLRQKLREAGLAAASTISLKTTPPELRRKVVAPRIILQRQRECRSQLLRLEWQLAQLAEIPDEGQSQSIESSYRLNQAAEAVLKCQLECSEQPGSIDRLSAWRDACESLDQRLRLWEHELPERLQATIVKLSSGSYEPETAARIWRRVPRSVAMMNAQRERIVDIDEFVGQSQLAEWRVLLVFLARRAQAAVSDTSPPKAEYLTATAEGFRQAALSISTVPPMPPQSPPSLRMSGVTELLLSIEEEREYLVTVTNRRNISQNVWIMIDYDRELLNVRPPADYAVFSESSPSNADRNPSDIRENAPNPMTRGLPPSLNLETGTSRVLRFVVRRRGSREWPTKLIVKATTDDCDVRHECSVQTPAPAAIELTLEGVAGSWTATPIGFQLHPFPNQRTTYQILVKSRGLSRVVDLDLFPLERRLIVPIPIATMSKEQSETFLRSLPLGPRMATVTDFKVEGNGTSRAISFTGPPPPELDKPTSNGKESIPLPASIGDLPFGAIITITDQSIGSKIVKQLEFAPQRPRRYVTSRVDYQPDNQLIEIVVARREKVATPERIKVLCELDSFARDATPARPVVSEIAEGQSEIRFTLPVPVAFDRLRLAIAIDGYPRAYRYQISSRQQSGEVPEDTSSLEVRTSIQEVPGRFACPRKFVEANVEVDAPTGNLSEVQGFWEIGIDKGLDRELAGDNVLRFMTDRQARPRLSGYSPEGGLAIDTPVGDYPVQLPAEGICNQRAQILAHANFSGRDAWSVPVEIVLDGTGPRLTNIAVGPGKSVMSGEEVEVMATVQDGELSGVAKIEVGFDIEGSGRFAKEPPPLLAAPGKNGSWVVRLPTEKMPPASYTVLLRATDKVGNVGDYSRMVVTLISKEDRDRQQAAIRVTLRGGVEYDKKPVADVKVTLTPVATDSPVTGEKKGGGNASGTTVADPVVEPVKTDQNGMFVFPAVPHGKFKLRAEGVYRNKTRKTEMDVTIDAQTPFKPAPQLKLP